MPSTKSTKSTLPAGGGAFALDRVTIGVFGNDQPGHRLSVGSDRAIETPLCSQQGWILPAGANGLCEYDAPLDVVMVDIDGGLLEEAGLRNAKDFAPVIGDLDPLVLQLALNAVQDGAGNRLYRETMDRALASQLANLLQDRKISHAVAEDPRLDRVLAYIHDNLSEDLSLAVMAAEAGMSDFHFSRAFKKETGKSPLQYVIAARMALAKVLLKTTKLNVAEISYRVGYHDLSRFGQHFKRATGTTPAKFRAN